MSEPQFYLSSWADLRIWASEIETERGRDQVEHELSTGDVHPIQDRGQAMIRSRITFLFDWMVGEDISPDDRLKAFIATLDEKPRIFRHPIEGSFSARIKGFVYRVSGRSITGNGEIVPAGVVTAISPAGVDGIPAAGAGAVDAAATAAEIEFSEVAVPTAIPAAARIAADKWASDENPNPRVILAETGSLTSQLGELADTLDSNLAKWQAFKATIMLADAIRSAADTITSDAPSTFVIRIANAVALRSLVSSLYGADEADLRYRQVMQLNDVPNPAWLEPGTELVMPAIAPRGRSG